MTIQAIETKYKGYRFRSRLEARWAVFFDALGIEWEYEKEGFTNGQDYYLPDFYLPQHKVWVEVKGEKDALANEHDKMVSFLDWGGCLPDIDECFNEDYVDGGFLILGNIPDPTTEGIHFYPIIRHNEGLLRSWITFFLPKNGMCIYTFEFFFVWPYKFDIRKTRLNYDTGSDTDSSHFFAESRIFERQYYKFGLSEKAFENIERITRKGYTLARSARFEHGDVIYS